MMENLRGVATRQRIKESHKGGRRNSVRCIGALARAFTLHLNIYDVILFIDNT